VQRDRQFDDAEARAQVSAGLADGADGFGAQFVGQLPQLAFLKLPEIGGKLDLVEKLGGVGHGTSVVTLYT
jgi:hypothetical protein